MKDEFFGNYDEFFQAIAPKNDDSINNEEASSIVKHHITVIANYFSNEQVLYESFELKPCIESTGKLIICFYTEYDYESYSFPLYFQMNQTEKVMIFFAEINAFFRPLYAVRTP